MPTMYQEPEETAPIKPQVPTKAPAAVDDPSKLKGLMAQPKADYVRPLKETASADTLRPMKEMVAKPMEEAPKAIRSTPKPILEDGGRELTQAAASQLKDIIKRDPGVRMGRALMDMAGRAMQRREPDRKG